MDAITLYSSLLDWEWASCPETLSLWVHILFRASDEERRWKGITIPKGGFVTNLAELSEGSGLSVKQVRTHLKRLVSSGYIILKGTNKYTLITIYNSDTCDRKNKDEGKQRANKGQTKGKQNISATDCKPDSYESTNDEQGNQRANNTQNSRAMFINNINKYKSSRIENKKKERVSKDTPKKEEQEKELDAVAAAIDALADECTCGLEPCSNPCTAVSDACSLGRSGLNLDFIDSELLPTFLEYLEMRRKIRKPIKTQRAITARYNKLKVLSDGDTALAKKIIQQSIDYEWQDFYQLKSEDNGSNNNRQARFRSEEDFSDRHYDTTLSDWTPSGGGSGADEELLP